MYVLAPAAPHTSIFIVEAYLQCVDTHTYMCVLAGQALNSQLGLLSEQYIATQLM